MSYLDEFKKQIKKKNFNKYLQLWEEYCCDEKVNPEELIAVLRETKASEFAESIGKVIETTLPLWQMIEDRDASYEVLKLILDLQTTDSDLLAETALNAIKENYGDDPLFQERLRLIGLRGSGSFQGAISNYELLDHMKKGNFIFHTGGWGTGEIMDISSLREQVTIEFENVGGLKYFSFKNAFKTLIPLNSKSFLARRFAFPDALEAEARKDPASIIHLLLEDLGPKTAAEIKEEMSELVIPEEDWAKWWQNARAKLKRDTMIEVPTNLQDPFKIRAAEVTHEEKLLSEIQKESEPRQIILTAYNYIRDFPTILKQEDVSSSLHDRIFKLVTTGQLDPADELQARLLLYHSFDVDFEEEPLSNYIRQLENPEKIILDMEIIAFKKRALTWMREVREDWDQIFLNLLQTLAQSQIRDYILECLNQGGTQEALIETLRQLLRSPEKNPNLFVWYFQKVVQKEDKGIPFSDHDGRCRFAESFLILMSNLESRPDQKELAKKMYNLVIQKRFLLVRSIMKDTSAEFLKEFLLLASKCQSFSDHERKILQSLAEVANPELKESQAEAQDHDHIFWATEEGYSKTKARIEQISSKEIVENAREIEAARALGDLRENSEFKFAKEKRARLQGELKFLLGQLNHARLITKNDISLTEAGIGNIIELENGNGQTQTYTILGPWEADADKNILSIHSRLAQAMIGKKIGEKILFRDEEFTITGLKSYLHE